MFAALSNALQTAVDTIAPPVPLLTDLIYHWNVLEKHMINDGRTQRTNVETTKILPHLHQILRIIKEEVDTTVGDDVGLCMEYLIENKLLDTLVESSKKDVPVGIIQYTLKFATTIIPTLNRVLMGNAAINSPLKKLVKICGQSVASPYESEEVDFICSICDKLMRETSLFPCFFDITDTCEIFNSADDHIILIESDGQSKVQKKTSFPLLNVLTNMCLSVDYELSKKAATSLANCLTVTQPLIAAHYIASNMCTNLINHLIDLFLLIPENVNSEILRNTYIGWDESEFKCSDLLDSQCKINILKYSRFLSFIDHLVSSSQPSIGEELSKCFREEFLHKIFEPMAMHLNTYHVGHLTKLAKQINSSLLLSEYAHWLLGECKGPETKGSSIYPIKEALIEYCYTDPPDNFNECLRLFEEILSKPCEYIISNLVLVNLCNRGYLDSNSEYQIDSWSDEEDERMKRRDQVEMTEKKKLCMSRTLAPSYTDRIVNSFLDIVPKSLRSGDESIGINNDCYMEEANGQFEEILTMVSNFNWPREAVMPENISDTSSSDSRTEADSSQYFYEGAFLNMIFDKLILMPEQSYENNLLLTSVISKLALLPHPYLHEYLLNPFIPLSPGTRSFFVILNEVIDTIKKKIFIIPYAQDKLLTIRSQIFNEEKISLEIIDDENEIQLLKNLIVIEEFSKELAAIVHVKYEFGSFSPDWE